MSAKDLTLEYAPTARATCKGCKLKIDKGALRIGVESDMGDYSVFAWRHLDCYNLGRKYKDIDPKDINGYYELKKQDKTAVVDYFEGGGKRKTAKETVQDLLEESDKKQKKEEVKNKRVTRNNKKASKEEEEEEESDESEGESSGDDKKKKKKSQLKKKSELKEKNENMGYTTEELEKFKEYVDMFSKKPTEYLKNLLATNNQPKTGNKDELVIKCSDGKLKGQIPICSACGGGKLRFNYRTGIYKCPGYMDDDVFTNCGKSFSLKEITREKWIDDII